MTEQMNVPKLRFGEFEGDWKSFSMRDISKINQGLQIPISDRFTEFKEGSYFYITNEFLRPNSTTKYYIDTPSERVICDEKDILMTRTGNTGQVVTDVAGVFHNNFFKITYTNEVEKRFLVEFLRLPTTQSMILRYAGTSTIPDLNHGDFYRLKIEIPSLPEQQKIASFLSKVDEKIGLLSEKKDKLTEYKRGVMQQLFNGKWHEQDGQLTFTPPTLRFKADDGSEFPDWEEKTLGDVLTIGNGRDYKHLSEGDIPVFGTGGYMTSVAGYLHDGETVFIGRKGTINKPYMFNGKFWTVDTLFYTKEFKEILPKFVYAIFQKINWSLYNEATGVPSLSKSTINKIRLNLPSLSEQEKIVSFLSALDKKIDLTNSELNKAKEWKRGLLQQMFV